MSDAGSTEDDYRVIEEKLFWRKSRSVAFGVTPPPGKPEPVRRPAKVAQQLALAHHLQNAIDRGLVGDMAAVARKLGLTRARITQLFDLLMLAADLQEHVLTLEAIDGAEPMAERTLRAVAHAGTWAEQRAAWAALCEITSSLDMERGGVRKVSRPPGGQPSHDRRAEGAADHG